MDRNEESVRPPEIAVHTWLEPVLGGPGEKISRIKAAGVTAIEAGYPVFVSQPEKVVASNCRFLQDAGIRLWAVHAPFGEAFDLSDPHDAARRRAVEYHKFVLSRVALGNGSLMVIHPGSGGPSVDGNLAFTLLMASLEELVPTAEQLRVQLAIENLAYHTLGSDEVMLRRVVEEIDSPWLGVCFDTGHAHLAAGVMRTLEVLRDLIITFHLADNDGTRDLHLQPPYGTIPWKEFSAVFWEMGFDKPVVVEARPWGEAGYAQQIREVGAVLEGGLLTLDVAGRSVRAQCLQCGHYCFGDPDDPWCACP